jgi:hypothetical protein
MALKAWTNRGGRWGPPASLVVFFTSLLPNLFQEHRLGILISVLNLVTAGIAMSITIISSYLWGRTGIQYYAQWILVGGYCPLWSSDSSGGPCSYHPEITAIVNGSVANCFCVSSPTHRGDDINLSHSQNKVATSEYLLGIISSTVVLLPLALFCAYWVTRGIQFFSKSVLETSNHLG